ncbi:carbonyl reductase [NADPH] 3-like isoform X2 [Spodoptera litura]|uniref:Carbonyl reductase [NADPH] 3-like isoform X2 n=1 Tax=Spodoptera litura TaxID=69820 RepID=A0A9J7ETD1_SPOLT|nr:carbonyl reductase [NADPH] 3-like isoform X2 [Spodoptera litura]
MNTNIIYTTMSVNKVAVVTGANKGLGFCIVKKLCEKYSGKVYLTSRDEQRGGKACDELNKLGLNPFFHQLDVSDKKSVNNFVKHIREENEEVEILINNAGILFLKDAPEPKSFQAEQTIFVNFTALVDFTEAILPFMKNGGRIVNISSSSGHLCRVPSGDIRSKFQSEMLTLEELKTLVSSYVEDVKQDEEINKGWGDSPYVVSKVAVNAYTFMLQRRLAPKGITVNCVHPGYVMSDMTRGGGSITPDDAANVPVRLALTPWGAGLYVWHNGTVVPWDGPDPRGYIDGRKV